MRKKPGPSFRLFLFAESHLPDWDYHYPCLFPTLNTVFFKRTAWNEVGGGTPWTAHGPGGDVAVSEELVRLTPELAVELPRALRDDLEDRFQSACANGSMAAATGSSSSASGTTLCPTQCSWPRKKVSLPWTSTPN